MSAWHYSRPSKSPKQARWTSAGFPTQEQAMKAAVAKASNRVITDPALVKQLWASLQGIGWRLEFK